MNNINDKHFKEWQQSGVHPAIINANVRTLKEHDAFEHLFYSPALTRTNTGRLSGSFLKQYKHLMHGGWWCNGIDPLDNFAPMVWGCFKPNRPRLNSESQNTKAFKKGKVKAIKYEHPAKTKTRMFFLDVPVEARTGFLKDADPALPLWEWILNNPEIPIIITEGAKKAGCLLSLGYPAIALPGIWNGQDKKTDDMGLFAGRDLRPELALFAQDKRPISFCFDQDEKETTRAQVLKAMLATGQLFVEKGCIVSVTTWSAPEKGVDDFVVEHGAKAFHDCFAKSTPLALFEGNKLWELTYQPNVSLNQQYLGKLPYPASGLACIKSPKGTGKTQALLELIRAPHAKKQALEQEWDAAVQHIMNERNTAVQQVNDHCEKAIKNLQEKHTAETSLLFDLFNEKANHDAALEKAINTQRLTAESSIKKIEQDYASKKKDCAADYRIRLRQAVREIHHRKVLVITHRIQLGRAICTSLGIDWIDNLQDTFAKGLFGYGICVDSVHPLSQGRFNPEDWTGSIVILDEVEQVFWHLLNSDTCYEKRVQIVQTFQALLSVVATTGGLIIAQDADLSDVSINYIRDLIKQGADIDITPWLLINEYQEEETRWNIGYFNMTQPTLILSGMQEFIESGRRFIVHVDGQRAKSKYGTINLESWCQERIDEVGGDMKILRIDSNSASDPNHPAFGFSDNINKLVAQYDIVIASPSIGTGVSIDIKGHFDGVFGIFQGVCPENETRQALARLREPVPRFVWAKTSGVGGVGNGASHPYALKQSTQKKVAVAIKALKSIDETFDPLDDEEAIDFVSFNAWAKMGARCNSSIKQYRESLKRGFIREGHRLIIYSGKDDLGDIFKDQIKKCRDRNWQQDIQDVTEADDLSEMQFLKLKDQRQRTKPESLSIRKHNLKLRYGVEVTPELVERDANKWYGKIRLHYNTRTKQDILSERDKQHICGHLERGYGKVHLPDLRPQLGKIKTLLLFNPQQWFDQELSNLDPDLIAWAENVKQYRCDLKDIGLCNISMKATPIKVLIALAETIGAEINRLGQRRMEGDTRTRFYTFTIPDDGREAVFDVWRQRDEDMMAERAMKKQEQEQQKAAQQLASAPETLNAPTEAETPIPEALQQGYTPQPCHTTNNNIYIDNTPCDKTHVTSLQQDEQALPNETQTSPTAKEEGQGANTESLLDEAKHFIYRLSGMFRYKTLDEAQTALANISEAARRLIPELLEKADHSMKLRQVREWGFTPESFIETSLPETSWT